MTSNVNQISEGCVYSKPINEAEKTVGDGHNAVDKRNTRAIISKLIHLTHIDDTSYMQTYQLFIKAGSFLLQCEP